LGTTAIVYLPPDEPEDAVEDPLALLDDAPALELLVAALLLLELELPHAASDTAANNTASTPSAPRHRLLTPSLVTLFSSDTSNLPLNRG
jgi:hypothetical protein